MYTKMKSLTRCRLRSSRLSCIAHSRRNLSTASDENLGSVDAYNERIKALGERNETDNAVATLIAMIGDGLDPNEETVQVLVNVLAKSRPVFSPYQQQQLQQRSQSQPQPQQRHKH